MKKDYTKKAIHGSMIIFAFSIVSIFIGFFLRTFLAKNLTVAEYGLLYAVLAFFGLFAVFRDVGLNPALIKYIPEFLVNRDNVKIKSSIKLTFITQITITTIIFSSVLYFSSFLAKAFFKTELSIPVIFFIGLSFVASVLFHLMQSVFQGFQKMKLYAMLDPLRTTIVLVVSFISIELGFGITGVAFAYFLAVLLAGIVGLFIFLKIFNFYSVKSKIDKNLSKQLFSFAAPAIGGGMVSIVASYADTIMITYFRTLDEVGYYQVALPISDLITVFSISASIVIFPMVSELWIRNKKKEISSGLSTLTKFSLILLLPLALTIFVFSETIISVSFGSKYLPAVTALRVLIFAAIFQSLAAIYFAALKGIGKIKEAIKGIIILSILLFLLNFIFVQMFGIIGTAVAVMISYFITMLVTLRILRKNIRIKISPKDIIIILISTIAAVIVGHYMKENFSLFYDIPGMLVSVLIYIILIIELGGVRKDEMKTLERVGIKLPAFLYKITRR